MRAAIDELHAALGVLHRSALDRHLRPGADPARTRAALEEVGLPATGELLDLYAWRDGTDVAPLTAVDDVHLVPGFYLLSLADAVATHRAFVPDPRWGSGWLPLLADGGGDFYVTDLHGGGAVRHVRVDEQEHPVEFLTLTAMIRTFATACERGVVVVDDDGYLEMDDDALAAVAAELNPEVPWWA